jgi:hypothetical protein
MKITRKLTVAAAVLPALILSFMSCHTETPMGIDNVDPKINLIQVYTDADTLYNAEDSTLVFKDFQENIIEGNYYFEFSASDDQEIYRLDIMAGDKYSDDAFKIGSASSVPENGQVTFTLTYKEFPVIQDQNPQEFFIFGKVTDESENSLESVKLGFNVIKVFPFDLFYDALGEIVEIEGDSVDFREKNGKLAFIQFMSKGCLSCVEEAQAMKAVYADPAYDLSKFSHSLFGNNTFTEAEFKSFKIRDYKLPFDCFWDGTDSYKTFFEGQLGRVIENEVFAVLPNGKIVIYNYLEGSFEDWVLATYNTAYPTR